MGITTATLRPTPPVAPSLQTSERLVHPPRTSPRSVLRQASGVIRLTEYAHGGGCACKLPPGELESLLAGLPGDGDDAAIVEAPDGTLLVATVDFFSPVVDDARDWGRI